MLNSASEDFAPEATMGFFFEFDAVNHVARCRWEGLITDDILLEGFSAADEFLASLIPCRGLVDFSDVTRFDVSNDTVRRMVDMPGVLGPESLHVIVAPKDLLYGLARMFEILSEKSHPNIHVVRTVKEAYALLGVISPQFSRVNVA